MEINLQVVGIFYNTKIQVNTSQPTVKDLMDAAVIAANNGNANPVNGNNAVKFCYSTNKAGEKEFLSSVSATYDETVNGRVLKTTYPAGEYFLAEHLSDRPAYTVWQYYMFDDQGRYLNPYGEAIPFTKQSLINVPWAFGGGSSNVARVTWRLVTILGQPTTPQNDQNMDLIARGSSPLMRTPA